MTADIRGSALVERLRNADRRIGWYDKKGVWVGGAPLLKDAAEEIEALTKALRALDLWCKIKGVTDGPAIEQARSLLQRIEGE